MEVTLLLDNAGTLILFRVGVQDAEALAKEFWPGALMMARID